MLRQSCPYCQGPVNVLTTDLGRMVQCDRVGCGQFFLATSPAPAPKPAPYEFIPSQPYLTGPHRCRVCDGQVSKAINRRRCTILHRPSRLDDTDTRDNCRMDIYAAIYYCPHCNGRTILETPYDQWGAEVTCPVCLNPFQAPRDDVLHETLGDAREGTTMCFRCPSCETTPRCDTLRKGQPITGTTVVCLVCQQMIVIPSHGEAVARAYRPR